MSTPATMRVKATHEPSQGPFVVINAQDFDPSVHVPYQDTPPAGEPQAPATAPADTAKRRGRRITPNPEN